MSYETAPCPLLGKPGVKHKYEFKGLLVFSNAEFSFASAVSQSVGGSGGTYVLPTGIWYVFCNTNTKVQVHNGTSFVDWTAAAGKALVISDGVNVRLYNGGASAESSTLIKIA
jgi:hypothetical protein